MTTQHPPTPAPRAQTASHNFRIVTELAETSWCFDLFDNGELVDSMDGYVSRAEAQEFADDAIETILELDSWKRGEVSA